MGAEAAVEQEATISEYLEANVIADGPTCASEGCCRPPSGTSPFSSLDCKETAQDSEDGASANTIRVAMLDQGMAGLVETTFDLGSNDAQCTVGQNGGLVMCIPEGQDIGEALDLAFKA